MAQPPSALHLQKVLQIIAEQRIVCDALNIAATGYIRQPGRLLALDGSRTRTMACELCCVER